jgi:2-oxoglutarate ferredoxin oxidoreductase subunit beta
LEKAIRMPGFTFVDVISPCPTQFGRRNRIADTAQLYDHVESICREPEEVQSMPVEERLQYFAIGEFTQ